ncbi:hypothetical protein MTO96_024230 [Rhipicephalus appendiculatus]
MVALTAKRRLLNKLISLTKDLLTFYDLRSSTSLFSNASGPTPTHQVYTLSPAASEKKNSLRAKARQRASLFEQRVQQHQVRVPVLSLTFPNSSGVWHVRKAAHTKRRELG